MKKNVLIAVLSAVALFPLMFFCSCGAQTPADSTEPPSDTPALTTETNSAPEPADGKIRLVIGGEGKAVLIRSENAAKAVSTAVSSLRNYIKELTGCRLDAAIDVDVKERADIEIIIGDTNRKTADEADISKGSFSVFVEETDGKTAIYLLGGSDFHVQYAVEHFIAECIEWDGETLFVDKSVKKLYKFMFNDYEKQGLEVVKKVKAISLSTRNTSNKASTLSAVTNVHAVAMLTGEYSLNRTRSLYNICGTDLGFPVFHNGKLWFFFGDTFSEGEMKGGWRTNTAAYTTDLDFSDGIIFDGMYSTTDDGYASELIKGLKNPYTEYSKIPTGAISLNGTLYFYFMSVNNWDSAAGWDCNYGGLAKSTDDGKTWSIVNGVQWPGDSKYCQNSPVLCEEDGKIYITGITGGRQGFARMMRVDKDKIEDLSAYEYLTGYTAECEPIWTKGEEGIRNEFPLIDRKVSENTIVYNEYLGEWMITFKKDSTLYLYTSKTPAGPYACSAELTFPSIGAGLYGGFTCSALMQEDGKKMALIMSTWEPCYNTFVLEMTLSKK